MKLILGPLRSLRSKILYSRDYKRLETKTEDDRTFGLGSRIRGAVG